MLVGMCYVFRSLLNRNVKVIHSSSFATDYGVLESNTTITEYVVSKIWQ